jgi:CubicO group peptidase (beta-lactamase class C family)
MSIVIARALRFLPAAVAIAACGSKPPPPAPLPPLSPTADPPPSVGAPAAPAEPARTAKQRLAADTPMTTSDGNTFIAPAEWSVETHGKLTLLESPEGDSWFAIVDVGEATDARAAIAAAWGGYPRKRELPVRAEIPLSDKDGWQNQLRVGYQTSPNDKRIVVAGAMQRAGKWTVTLVDMVEGVAEKRSAATALIYGRLLPRGYERETFAGNKAHALDAARLEQLGAFVERAQQALGVPGVSIGIVQGGKVVFARGFGVRELGKPAKVDGDTLYIVASNTKALTTLLLGKLVDDKKLTWDTPVTQVMPQFKLGDAETTSRVHVRHLVCACTGLPRQDLEWLLEFGKSTPAKSLATLATMQPTSKFGEMYQYSNTLAAAAGFVGAYVLSPKLELGAAYDQAMQSRVFGPLGMTSTTFDFKKALRGNHATAHSLDIDGKPALGLMAVNYAVVPVRPAGGAWSNVKDMLKYVQMELAKGVLPDGKRYISEGVLADRQQPQVAMGRDRTYGMGLGVSTQWGTPVVSHGGSLIGYKSQMFWLPEHGVGAVVLTNGDPGGALHATFMRKLVEVLFDGKPEADNDLAAAAKATQERIAGERKLLALPPDQEAAGKLATKYVNDALGEIAVTRKGDRVTLDFGEWKSDVGSRKNPDGTMSLLTIAPGVTYLELVVGAAGQKRTLILRDPQHEYVFTEK